MSRIRNVARRASELWLKTSQNDQPTVGTIPVDQETLQRMRADWNSRAAKNAKHYVQNGKTDWADRDFFRSGEINVAELVMTDMPSICGPGRSPLDLSMVEIGCGVGRMTRMLARVFGHVTAIDVSDEMVARARESTAGLDNVTVMLGDGATLQPLASSSHDFAFSFIVLQHVPSLAVINSYCREVARVLRPGSLFKLQVRGDLHPRTQPWNTWEGYPVSPADASALAAGAGLTLERSEGSESQYYWLWLRRPPAPAAE